MGRGSGARTAHLQGAVLTVHVTRWSDAVEVPWRNGGGLTRELFVAGDSPFDWRLSAATIAVDGPFSEFAGIDRILMLLRGSGVRLWFSDDGSCESVDRVGQYVEFAGERPVAATLVAGTTVDLNLMWRRDRYCAAVQPTLDAPGTDIVVVHIVDGSCTVDVAGGVDGSCRLGAGDSAWWACDDGRIASLDGVVVRFDLVSIA